MTCLSKGYTDVKSKRGRRKVAPFLRRLSEIESGFLGLSEDDKRRGFGYIATLWAHTCTDMEIKLRTAGVTEDGKPFTAPRGEFVKTYGMYQQKTK